MRQTTSGCSGFGCRLLPRLRKTSSSKASGAGANLIRQIINFRSAAVENEQLKQKLAQTETELRNARASVEENERLKGLLNLKEQTGYNQIAASVIARDSSVWFNTITINRGSSSGVGLNMPVVTAGGIVGRVIAVSPWTAQVMMITDEKALPARSSDNSVDQAHSAR